MGDGLWTGSIVATKRLFASCGRFVNVDVPQSMKYLQGKTHKGNISGSGKGSGEDAGDRRGRGEDAAGDRGKRGATIGVEKCGEGDCTIQMQTPTIRGS
jgi:hypothetical protein